MASIDNKQIKNVIFDVGGVLIDYRWKQMLIDFGYSDEQAEISGLRILSHPIWRDMDKGIISEEDVILAYKEMFPEDSSLIDHLFTRADLMHVCRENLYPIIESLFDRGYKVYILSNYSNRLFNIHTKTIPFFDKCSGIVVSCDIKMLKPEPEIYRYILSKYNLVAEECLFLDDNEDNVAGAITVGINARCVKTSDDVINELEPLLS